MTTSIDHLIDHLKTVENFVLAVSRDIVCRRATKQIISDEQGSLFALSLTTGMHRLGKLVGKVVCWIRRMLRCRRFTKRTVD